MLYTTEKPFMPSPVAMMWISKILLVGTEYAIPIISSPDNYFTLERLETHPDQSALQHHNIHPAHRSSQELRKKIPIGSGPSLAGLSPDSALARNLRFKALKLKDHLERLFALRQQDRSFTVVLDFCIIITLSSSDTIVTI